MRKSHFSQCEYCGMQFETEQLRCPKCDQNVYEPNAKRTLEVDIAHQRQTIDMATEQFYQALEEAQQHNYGKLRLIVGGGKINAEIGKLIDAEVWRENIISGQHEAYNNGAYILRLK